jgi:hypothetical protein
MVMITQAIKNRIKGGGEKPEHPLRHTLTHTYIPPQQARGPAGDIIAQPSTVNTSTKGPDLDSSSPTPRSTLKT